MITQTSEKLTAEPTGFPPDLLFGDLNYTAYQFGDGIYSKSSTPRPGFEPGSKAPQASRMSTTLPGPGLHTCPLASPVYDEFLR